MIDEIIKYVGLIALAIPVAFVMIKFFAQRIFENYLLKSIETHKSNLERVNISHEIQFSSLHKERANVVKALYLKLFEYQKTIILFFNTELEEGGEEIDLKLRLNSWTNAVVDFSDYFHLNRIYFSKDLCIIIDTLNNELENVNKDTKIFLRSFKLVDEQVAAIKNKDKRFTDLQHKVNEILDRDIMRITNDLEAEFRKILGVE